MSSKEKMVRLTKVSLSVRILLFVFLPLWGLSAASIGIGTYYLADLQTSKLKGDLKLIARAIDVPIGEAIRKGDIETVQRTLDAIFDLGQVYGASVYNQDGQRIAAAGIAKRSNKYNPIALELLEVGRDANVYQRQAGKQVYSHFLPITDKRGQISSLVEITRRASDFSSSMSTLSYSAWTVWGVIGLLTLIIVYLGHYRAAGRDVAQLTSTMAKIGQGQLGLRAADSNTYELSSIALALNRMLDDIALAQEKILAHQEYETKLNLRLERNERMATLGRFVGGVAHELGAPLNVIDGRARRLSRFIDKNSALHELTSIRGQVKRLTRIVRQLLDFSRNSNQKEKVLILDLVVHARESLNHEQMESSPLITINVPNHLSVFVDPDLFELALINLLRNASQAAQENVFVGYGESHDHWWITISDDGQSIPIDMDLPQLLEPFFTTKPKGQGTGLGLAIVNNIVNDHHGELMLRRSEQGGLIVTLQFSKEQWV